MGAALSACQKSATIMNTAAECNDSMGPTSLLFAIPPTVKIPALSLASISAFYTWILAQIHAPKATRVYPLFGPAVPIRKIANKKEADVIATMDDGTPIFIRYGVVTKDYSTNEGGICFAQALQSLNKSGYSIIEIDNGNQGLLRANSDGSFGGLKTTFMYSPSPDPSDFKNPSFTNFQISYFPQEFVANGVILQFDSSISGLVGLLNVTVAPVTGSSATVLKVAVNTACASTDLIALFGATLALVGNFVITNELGAVVTPTGVTIVSGALNFAGTFPTGHTYSVALAAPSVLLAAGIQGYEGTIAAAITL